MFGRIKKSWQYCLENWLRLLAAVIATVGMLALCVLLVAIGVMFFKDLKETINKKL